MSEEQAVPEASAPPAEATSDTPEHFGIFEPEAPEAETPAAEAAPEPAAPPADPKLNHAYEQAVKLDAELREKKKALEAAESELSSFKKLREAGDPGEVLKHLGYDLDSVLDSFIASEPETPEEPSGDPVARKALAEAEALRKELEAEREARVTYQEQAVKQQHVGHLQGMVEGQKDNLPLLASLSEQNPEYLADVYEYAKKLHAETGEAPDYPALLKKAEEHWLEHYRPLYEKLSKINAFRGDAQPEVPAAMPAPAAQPQTASTTLSNSLSSESPARTQREMTAEEADLEFIKSMKESGWSTD